ncbi:MAG TPA: hypothetical protein VFC01_16880 [Mycobacterium sp.]|nr:hypothetical protein [Mycobacterium sp.]
MSASSAITINQTQQDIAARLPQADPPLSDDDADAEIVYAPAPGDRGTEVRVLLPNSPGGLGQKVAAVMGLDAQRELDDALRRFKQLLETGEIARSDGSPTGTDARAQRSQQPAQPMGAYK